MVVVGGGITGLAAAYALGLEGGPDLKVTVVEAGAAVGGKLRSGEVDGVTVDVGAESFLARRPEAVQLAGSVGLGAELVHPATAGASVWTRGRLRPLPAGTVLGVPTDLAALARSRVLSARGLCRVPLDLLRPAPPQPADVTVGSYVRARLGAEVVDRLVDPLLGGVYAGHAERLSLAATVPALAAVARRGGSLLRGARNATGTRTGTGGGTGPVFATLAGGLHRLAAAVLAASGAELRLATVVRGLDPVPGGGWRLTVGPTRAPESLRADAVVLAVPAASAARLLAPLVPVAAAALAAVDYASVGIVTLAYPAAAVPPLPGSGFLVPAVDARVTKAVTFSTAKWAALAVATPGRVLVRASVGRAGEARDLQRDDPELIRSVAAELAAAVGLPAAPRAATVTRWGGALPQYAVGHLDLVAGLRRALAAYDGIAVCGAAYDGVGIPACIASGRAAAAAVLVAAAVRTPSSS